MKECILFNHLIQKLKIQNWQKFFEIEIPINNPYMYQNHFFLQKVNSRGKNQSRLILLSNKVNYIYIYIYENILNISLVYL